MPNHPEPRRIPTTDDTGHNSPAPAASWGEPEREQTSPRGSVPQVTSQTQRIPRKRQQQRKKDAARPTWQRVGALRGALALAASGLMMVLATGVQMLEETGLVGVRGTFTVDYCPSGNRKSSPPCYGDFVAHGDSPAKKVSGRLDKAGDYASGTKVAAVKDIVSAEGRYRETNTGETALSLVTALCILLCLALGTHWTHNWPRALGS